MEMRLEMLGECGGIVAFEGDEMAEIPRVALEDRDISLSSGWPLDCLVLLIDRHEPEAAGLEMQMIWRRSAAARAVVEHRVSRRHRARQLQQRLKLNRPQPLRRVPAMRDR